MKSKQELSPQDHKALLQVLQTRFEKNMKRHPHIQWSEVQSRLEANPSALWSIQKMEDTEGEPDVVEGFQQLSEIVFCDCSAESPKGRRSLCYDHEALEARKEHKPESSAVFMASEMGVELMTEEQYRHLQTLGKFDTKTSSWVKTPEAIRKLDGALFCDRRYEQVFVYHNGASSYYAARGFRALLKI